MQFLASEERDAIRFSWNAWPSTRIEAGRMVVPLSTMYTPIKYIENLAQVPYEPIFCKGQACSCVLNPYCQVDYMNKIWICPFCLTRNHFPHLYADIRPDNLPAELIEDCSTIEYILPQPVSSPPVFLFVVDTAVIEEELQQIKDSLIQSLLLLPQNSMVGLITFGKNVHVHELGFPECSRSHVLNGSKEYTPAQVADLLGLGPQEQKVPESHYRYLLPVSECEFTLTSILEDLGRDPWPSKADQRPARCTGVAVAVAIGLLETTFKKQPARIMVFVGGPPCVGPGKVVDQGLAETIRSHHDLIKGNAPHYTKALKYYEGLAKRVADNGHVMDIFACSLDQVGTAEMKVMVEKSGGFLVLNDFFASKVFTESFRRVFTRDAQDNLTMAFGAEIEVFTSREIKVNGLIAPCSSLDKRGPCVGDREVGLGNTCAWLLGAIDPATTVALYYDIANSATPITDGRNGYIQLVTRYRHSSGTARVRVTTVTVPFVDGSSQHGQMRLRESFDQETSAVIMARLAVYKSESEFAFDILRWLDRMLIRLVARCADYNKDPNSFSLSPGFAYYPQFMFHLRRSQFLQVFNSSPDETAFYRLVLTRENVTNSLIMIQPTLMAYSLDGPAQPALLDVSSIAPTRILVLDTFFHVGVFYGDTVARWRNDKIHERPEYEYVAELLRAPVNDAEAIMNSRFPMPIFVESDQGKSQWRFLIAKLNPSVTHNTPQGYGDGQPPVFTDDVSLRVFMEHLKKFAMQQQN
eukprot:TRINITY_DN443_c0_g3_i1.p1 TRINITY_DN443_c0_g3~~TRINITY_DN443_c0_g3_i1.p1  ORF type:complete len:751 (+),score=216.56 TRINITY_DN443_c0_g3_i1:95-2347(+)